MPLLLIGSGLVLVITGLNGDAAQLWGLLAADFQGTGSYRYWAVSIIVLGAIGYIPSLEQFSHLFLVLVIVALLLNNKGFFTQLQTFISGTPATNPNSVGTGLSGQAGGAVFSQ